MAKHFRSVQRDQLAMLGQDMRDWLPADHVVWFLIDVMESLDLSVFEKRSRLGGTGRAPYDPAVLLTVLIYGYALGERSSRQLERLCTQDVAFRIVTGQDHPDHTTLSRFRQADTAAFEDIFAQVLRLLRSAGMVRLGVLAIDGTKISANAAMSANLSDKRLRTEIEKIVKEADDADAAENDLYGTARGDEVPEQWRDRKTRKERIKNAIKEMAEENQRRSQPAQERAAKRVQRAQQALDNIRAAEQRRYDTAVSNRAQANAEQRKGRRNNRLIPVDERSRVRDYADKLKAARHHHHDIAKGADVAFKVNLTDPQSRTMKTAQGWIQGFNCQLAVTADQVILAAYAVNDSNDVEQYIPAVTAAQNAAEHLADITVGPHEPTSIGTVLADAGYHSHTNLHAPGPNRLIPAGKQNTATKTAAENPTEGPPPVGATPAEAMAWQLRTPQGINTYQLRKTLVEPVNGHLKDRTGLRRFSRRGIAAANSELKLAATALNLMKLYRHQLA